MEYLYKAEAYLSDTSFAFFAICVNKTHAAFMAAETKKTHTIYQEHAICGADCYIGVFDFVFISLVL